MALFGLLLTSKKFDFLDINNAKKCADDKQWYAKMCQITGKK
jgi:hypothetical protein